MRLVVRRWCDGDCWRFRRNMPSVQLHSGKTSTATSPTIGSRGAYCDSLSNTFNTCGTNSLMHRQDTPPLRRSLDVPFTTSLKALAVAKVGLWKKKINPALLRDRYRYRARRRMRLSLRLYMHPCTIRAVRYRRRLTCLEGCGCTLWYAWNCKCKRLSI